MPEFLRLALGIPGNRCRSQPSLSGCRRPAAIIVWLPPTRDVWLPPTRGAAQFSVGEAKKLRIPDKSGHLSVEPGVFCHFLSALCPVLAEECPGFGRFCHPWKAGKQARRFWVREFSLCHFVPFLPGVRLRRETLGQPTPERYEYDRDMVAGSYRGWKGASVSAVTFQLAMVHLMLKRLKPS